MLSADPGRTRFKTAPIVCYLFHGISDGTFAILPAALPFLIKDFSLSYFDAGFLYAAMLAVVVLFQPVAGSLADRFDELDLLALGDFLIFSTYLMSFLVKSYVDLLLFNMVYAVGFSLFHPVQYALLSRVAYDSTSRTKVMGISGSIGDAGYFIAIVSTGVIAGYVGWRFPFFVWGMLALFMMVVYLVLLRRRGPQSSPSRDLNPSIYLKGTSSRRIAILVVAISVLLGATYRTFVNFTTLFLTDVVHMTPAGSDFLFSAFVLFGVLGAFLSGYIVQYLGLTKALAVEFSVASACMFSLYLKPLQAFPAVVMPLAASGLALYATYPAIYSLAADFTSFGRRGLSYGFLVSTTFVGGFFISFIDGKLADLMASLTIVYLLGSVIALFAAALALYVPNMNGNL